MGKRIAAWSILTCFGLTSVAWALTADDYVIAGRQCLFERTVTGLVQAQDIFAAGIRDTDCPDCGRDRDLLFLHAVAKTALLLIDHNEVLAVDGFFALAEQFGIPLSAIAFYESPMDSGRGEQGCRLWQADADPQTIRQTLCDTVLAELGDAVATLDAIADSPDPFVMYLTPKETSLTGDLEIDYGDVLALKGLLLAYKALLAGQLALDLDAEVGELVVHCHAAVFLDTIEACPASGGHAVSLERASLPVEGPPRSVVDRGGAILERAGQDWGQAVECYLDAVGHIVVEDDPPGTDPQQDEFVYIDRDTESRLDRFRQTLMTFGDFFLQDGLAGPCIPERTETYDVYDTQASRLGRLTLVSSQPRFEGRSGRMTLADGRVLEVDWFGTLDEGRIGASLFATGGELEGWFEGTVESGRHVVSEGALDLWPMIDPGQAEEGPAASEEQPSGSLWAGGISLSSTLNWSKMAWTQLREAVLSASDQSFAAAQSATP